MKADMSNLSKVKNLTLLALMTALVVVFQLIAAFIPLGFNVGALCLIPIVIGAALLGPWAGAWRGRRFCGRRGWEEPPPVPCGARCWVWGWI